MLTRWITPYGERVFRWCFAHFVACVQKFCFFASRARTFLAFLFGSFSLFISLFFILFFWFFSFLVSFSFFFLFLTFSLSPQKRHQLTCRHCKIKGACKMMKFCYLCITNDDVFVKGFSVLICNVYFAIFIVSSLENFIYFIICNVLFAIFIKNANFLHTVCIVCNFIFAHLVVYVQFCYDDCNFCTRHSLCAILFLHTYNTVCNISKSIIFFII